MKPKCPRCSGPALKVIMYGLPLKFCPSDTCTILFGFWSPLILWGILPAHSALFVYEGSYLRAFRAWWKDSIE